MVGISVVIFRKMPYLNKLTPETHAEGDFFSDLFPEFLGGFKSFKLREYGNLWFIELEKFLRKLRVVSLKIDRVAEVWIKRIRKGNVSRTVNSVVEDKKEAEKPVISKVQPAPIMTPEDLKKEEQKLIIEIAKNPKDSTLYEVLGDLYEKMNNLSDAKESFEAAMELDPNSEELQKKHSKVAEKLNIKIN